MSELVFRDFKGNSSNLTNGLRPRSKVFVYKGLQGPMDVDLTNINNEIDKANIQFIKEHIGASQEEYNLELTRNWTRNTGRGENTFIASKLHELKLLNNEIADFILKYLDRIYWLEKGANFNTDRDQSSKKNPVDLREILELILPTVRDLQKIFRSIIETKYPSVLSTRTLQNDINRYMVDINERTGLELDKLDKRTKK